VRQIEVLCRQGIVARATQDAPETRVGSSTFARKVEAPGQTEHLAEMRRGFGRAAGPDGDVSKAVKCVELGDGVIHVEKRDALQVQDTRAIVTQVAACIVGGGNEGRGGASWIVGLLIQRCDELELVARSRLQPLSRKSLVGTLLVGGATGDDQAMLL
jgi:hypothetical protein